jgi:hypothetical protein
MPVDLRVGDTVQRLASRETRQTVTMSLPERPQTATLDPDNILLDLNAGNNTKEFPR